MVPFRDAGKWGLCDVAGNIVVQPFSAYFPEPYSFRLFKIFVNVKHGFVNRDGK